MSILISVKILVPHICIKIYQNTWCYKFWWFCFDNTKKWWKGLASILQFLQVPSSSDNDQWWWIVFLVWLTGERRLTLFSASTIVRDVHHLESPKRREQGLSLRRTWFRLCAAVITTSPWRHEANSKLFKKTIYSFICLLFTHVLQSGCHVLTEKYTTFSWLRFPKVQVFFLKTDWFRTMDHSTFKIIND